MEGLCRQIKNIVLIYRPKKNYHLKNRYNKILFLCIYFLYFVTYNAMYGVVLLKSYINMEFKEDEILLSDGIGVCVPNY